MIHHYINPSLIPGVGLAAGGLIAVSGLATLSGTGELPEFIGRLHPIGR
jgi:hypothetical protein